VAKVQLTVLNEEYHVEICASTMQCGNVWFGIAIRDCENGIRKRTGHFNLSTMMNTQQPLTSKGVKKLIDIATMRERKHNEY
jgi:hypothetical protein